MKAHKILIPNPCHEGWHNMTPDTNGRHCRSCNTVVRDFTQLSDTQIAYILQNSKGKMCGHFRENQVNRSIRIPKEQRGPDLLAVVLGMSLLLSACPAYSNSTEHDTPSVSLIEMLKDNPKCISPTDDHEYIKIKLQIVDGDNDAPLRHTSVTLLDENEAIITSTVSDENGYVTFSLTPDQKEKVRILKVEAVDYSNTRVLWDQDWQSEIEDVPVIELYAWEMMIDGMMIIEPYEEDEPKEKGLFNRKKN
ncbi:MAG: hypothetical protein ACFHU9_07035 [Fluviicola sp.]